MTKSKLFVAAAAISAALATPAFAQWQWQSQEPAAYASMYPNGDRSSAGSSLANPMTRETMASVPASKSPRPTVMRATKGK